MGKNISLPTTAQKNLRFLVVLRISFYSFGRYNYLYMV